MKLNPPCWKHVRRKPQWGELLIKRASITRTRCHRNKFKWNGWFMYTGLLRTLLGLAENPILRCDCNAHLGELDSGGTYTVRNAKLSVHDMCCRNTSPPASHGLLDAQVHMAGDPRRPWLRHLLGREPRLPNRCGEHRGQLWRCSQTQL